MDRASSLIFPGSRTLAGWWRGLSSHQPTALGIGYAFLHRIEAPVSVQIQQPVDPLAHLVLQALALKESACIRVVDLEQRLHLPAVIVQRVLADMQASGLLARSPPDGWEATERGRCALERRSFPMRAEVRRVFPFLERMDPTGQRVGPPSFAPIAECACAGWNVDRAHQFDVAALPSCFAQSKEWKQSSAFPLELEAVAEGTPLESWQQVIVDRPERVMLLLMLARQEVLGFAVKVDGWTLFDRTPVLRVPAPADALWPELTQQPPMAVWQEAWRSWCKQRQLPTNEVEICSLTHQPPRLEVQAPHRLVQRLQAAKSDLFKGDTWLLIGEGYMRMAVQLTIRLS